MHLVAVMLFSAFYEEFILGVLIIMTEENDYYVKAYFN